MKKIIFALLFIRVTLLGAQSIDDMEFGITLSPGITIAKIIDDYPQSSNESVSSDGYTFADENNLYGQAIKLNAHYNLSSHSAVGSGLSVYQLRFNPRNQDGSYLGTSVYYLHQLSIPFLYRYRSNEVTDQLYITGEIGPSIDIKVKEEVKGADYAHFMNFAQNRYDIDPERGRNGNNKKMGLFGGIGFSVQVSARAEYEVMDHWIISAGFSYRQNINNLLNNRLKYNDSNKTAITETLKFSSILLSFDMGVSYKF